MAKKCNQCGHDNDGAALQCVCGSDLQEGPLAPATEAPTASPPAEPKFVLRKIVFVLWALGLVPLFAAFSSHLHIAPIYRSLIGTGLLAVPALATFWLLGRDKQRLLLVSRIFFALWTICLSPMLLAIVDGLAQQGWPSGRFNRSIAEVLTLVLIVSVPAFLTGLCALVRSLRVAAVLALGTGVAALVIHGRLVQATAPIKGVMRRLIEVLDILAMGAKLWSYLSIPIGIAFIMGGIMTFILAHRAARPRA